MNLNHVSFINREKKESITFYKDFLGLNILSEFTVSKNLSMDIFGLDRELDVIVFGNSDLKVEIFIIPDFERRNEDVSHFCVEVNNLDDFLNRARAEKIKLSEGIRDGRKKYFIRDYSGNIIEVKQAEGKV